MSGDLLVKVKGKKEMHRQWKYGHLSWQEGLGRRLRYSTFFLSDFRDNLFYPHASQVYGQQERDWRSKVTPLVTKDQAHNHLRNMHGLWDLMRCIPET